MALERHEDRVIAEPSPWLGSLQVCPARHRVAVVPPLVRHSDGDEAVVACLEQERPLSRAEYRGSLDDVTALLERVHVRGDRSARLKLADPEPGMHSAVPLAHRRPPPESRSIRPSVTRTGDSPRGVNPGFAYHRWYANPGFTPLSAVARDGERGVRRPANQVTRHQGESVRVVPPGWHRHAAAFLRSTSAMR